MQFNESKSRNLDEGITEAATACLFLLLPLAFSNHGYAAIGSLKTNAIIPICAAFAVAGIIRRERTHICANRRYIIISAFLIADLFLSVFTAIDTKAHLENTSGPVFQMLYIFLFVSVASKTTAKTNRVLLYMSIACAVNFAVTVLQLAGYNPFMLYPVGTTYYDRQLLYLGEWLGTMGNTNIAGIWLAACTSCFLGSICTSKNGIAPIYQEIGLELSVASGILLDTVSYKVTLTAMILLAPIIIPQARRRIDAYTISAAMIAAASVFSMKYSAAAGEKWDSIAYIFILVAVYCIYRTMLTRGSKKSKSLSIKRKTLLLIYSGTGLLILTGIYFIPFSDASFPGQIHNLLHGIAEDNYGSSRIRIWKESWTAWRRATQNAPLRLLCGCGGPLTVLSDIRFTRALNGAVNAVTVVKNPHCLYLGWLYEYGVLGLAVFLSLVCSVFTRCLNRKRGERYLLTVSALMMIGLFCQGQALTDFLLWYFTGLGAAASGTENGTERRLPHDPDRGAKGQILLWQCFGTLPWEVIC